jgi:hypothetical protein
LSSQEKDLRCGTKMGETDTDAPAVTVCEISEQGVQPSSLQLAKFSDASREEGSCEDTKEADMSDLAQAAASDPRANRKDKVAGWVAKKYKQLRDARRRFQSAAETREQFCEQAELDNMEAGLLEDAAPGNDFKRLEIAVRKMVS